MAITVNIGPSINAAGITPDFNTLIEWWGDPGTVKDLVTAQEVTYVNLLPGTQSFVSQYFDMSGATTNQTYYFIIQAYSGFEFKGDFNADVPKIIASGSSVYAHMLITADYTVLKGIVFEGSGGLTSNSCLTFSPAHYGIVEYCGFRNIDATSTIVALVIANITNVIFRYNIINNCGCTLSTGSKAGSTFGISAITSFIHNNLILNIYSHITGGTGNRNAVIFGITGTGDSVAVNNIIGIFSTIPFGSGTSTAISIATITGVVDNNTYDSTMTTSAGTNNILIVPADEIANTSTGSSFDPHLLFDSDLISQGVDLTTIVKPTNVNSVLFSLALTSPKIDVDQQTFATYPIGVDSQTIYSYDSVGEVVFFPANEQQIIFPYVLIGSTDGTGYPCVFEEKVLNQDRTFLSKVKSVSIQKGLVPAITVCGVDELRVNYFLNQG